MTMHDKQPYELTLDAIEELMGPEARQTLIGLRTLAFSHIDEAVPVKVLLGDSDITKYMVVVGDLVREDRFTERFFVEWLQNTARPQLMPRLYYGYLIDDEVHDCTPIEWHDLAYDDWPWLAQQVKSHTPRI